MERPVLDAEDCEIILVTGLQSDKRLIFAPGNGLYNSSSTVTKPHKRSNAFLRTSDMNVRAPSLQGPGRTKDRGNVMDDNRNAVDGAWLVA